MEKDRSSSDRPVMVYPGCSSISLRGRDNGEADRLCRNSFLRVLYTSAVCDVGAYGSLAISSASQMAFSRSDQLAWHGMGWV